MKYKDTQNSLRAGHRQFIFTASPGLPVDVLAWGPTWVRFKDAYNTFPISTNMKMFSMMVECIYTEKAMMCQGNSCFYPRPNYTIKGNEDEHRQ